MRRLSAHCLQSPIDGLREREDTSIRRNGDAAIALFSRNLNDLLPVCTDFQINCSITWTKSVDAFDI